MLLTLPSSIKTNDLSGMRHRVEQLWSSWKKRCDRFLDAETVWNANALCPWTKKKHTRGTPINTHEHMHTQTDICKKHAHCSRVRYLLHDWWSVLCTPQWDCSDSRKQGCASTSAASCTINTTAESYPLTYRKGCSFELHLAQLKGSPGVVNKGEENCEIDSFGVWQFCNSSSTHLGIRPW